MNNIHSDIKQTPILQELKIGSGKHVPINIVSHIFTFLESNEIHVLVSKKIRDLSSQKAFEKLKNRSLIAPYLCGNENIDIKKILQTALTDLKKMHSPRHITRIFRTVTAPLTLELDRTAEYIEMANLLRMFPRVVMHIPYEQRPTRFEGTPFEQAVAIDRWMKDHTELLTERVRRLNLRKLKLTILPKAIGYMKGLESLNLRNNRLTFLTEELNDMPLGFLAIEYNSITRISPKLQPLYMTFDSDVIFEDENP